MLDTYPFPLGTSVFPLQLYCFPTKFAPIPIKAGPVPGGSSPDHAPHTPRPLPLSFPRHSDQFLSCRPQVISNKPLEGTVLLQSQATDVGCLSRLWCPVLRWIRLPGGCYSPNDGSLVRDIIEIVLSVLQVRLQQCSLRRILGIDEERIKRIKRIKRSERKSILHLEQSPGRLVQLLHLVVVQLLLDDVGDPVAPEYDRQREIDVVVDAVEALKRLD